MNFSLVLETVGTSLCDSHVPAVNREVSSKRTVSWNLNFVSKKVRSDRDYGQSETPATSTRGGPHIPTQYSLSQMSEVIYLKIYF